MPARPEGLVRSLADDVTRRALQGKPIGRQEAVALLREAQRDPWPLILSADRVRRRFRGRRVHLCSIAPVKVGRCTEDCRWCAQSAHWKAAVEPCGLMHTEEVVHLAREAAQHGAACFGLVTSGARLAPEELACVQEMARAVRSETGLDVCASAGALDADLASRLAAAGVRRYNHNLETSRAHFPQVCSTHTYEDRLASARAALAAGMELCCGGIFGIGETDADRVDLALAVRDAGAHVVPLNFLHPIPGTPLQNAVPLEPLKILSIVAMFRLVLPDRIIKLAGGRERNLGELQALMFLAGADACLVGNYLTTRGRPPADDLKLIRDLGLEPVGAGDPVTAAPVGA
ncbi:MAG: biotin synthase BioB [Phycisphaerae bacterium]|nr:biotin synthase BioB [Phycisphaerae bacterium]